LENDRDCILCLTELNRDRMKITFVVLLGLVLSATGGEPTAHWQQNSNSLALLDGKRVIWQFNFAANEGKPYFHPLSLNNGTVVTALRPPDHPWHRGLWWSWKLINGRNYWEEDKKTGQSEGLTEITKISMETNDNFSARIQMDLAYHPPKQPNLMTEKRTLTISAPDKAGNYTIDWDCSFTAGSEDLKLDRTPPHDWAGGYAGLSLRFSKSAMGWTFTSSEGTGGSKNIYGKSARWVDLSGRDGGVVIFDNPANPRHPTWWYPNDTMPWLTPAFLFHEAYTLKAEKTLCLRYRVLVHSENTDVKFLEQQWQTYTNLSTTLKTHNP